jgi:hypothetical protein
MAAGESPAANPRRRLPAALALLPDDPAQAAFLSQSLLDPESGPDEVLVIRDALMHHGTRDHIASAWRDQLEGKPTELTDTQLRAAGALAKMSPADPLWSPLAEPIARKLVQENPLLLAAWREVFEPIAASLNEPLRRIYANLADAEPRDRAFTLLFEFANGAGNPTQTVDLLALIADADPARFRQVLRGLETGPARDQAIAWLTPKIQTPARFDDALARRQGRWAMALLQLKHAEPVWPLFQHRDDPSLRTELIHNLARFGFDPALLVERLGSETDVSARRALILCLGEFPREIIPEPTRQALIEGFLGDYRADPDAGIHSAIDWLLRQRWGRAKDLEAIDKELASPNLPKDRQWFVNGQGQTFAILRGEAGKAIEFQMGSTQESDPDRDSDEVAHLCRIGRTFAIAAREVTVGQYARFLDEKPEGVKDWRANEQFKQQIPSADCAIGVVTWWEAAKYCNWLSQKEGIPEAQWCFPKTISPGMKLPSDYLERRGYRLPTEAEWEYACRAGAVSSRPYGRSEDWLNEYGWYISNSSRRMHSTGGKKPNDFGLFDFLGNAFEWCVDPYARRPAAKSTNPITDAVLDANFTEDNLRIFRGGSWSFPASDLRSGGRNWNRSVTEGPDVGFRPVRTFP